MTYDMKRLSTIMDGVASLIGESNEIKRINLNVVKGDADEVSLSVAFSPLTEQIPLRLEDGLGGARATVKDQGGVRPLDTALAAQEQQQPRLLRDGLVLAELTEARPTRNGTAAVCFSIIEGEDIGRKIYKGFGPHAFSGHDFGKLLDALGVNDIEKAIGKKLYITIKTRQSRSMRAAMENEVVGFAPAFVPPQPANLPGTAPASPSEPRSIADMMRQAASLLNQMREAASLDGKALDQGGEDQAHQDYADAEAELKAVLGEIRQEDIMARSRLHREQEARGRALAHLREVMRRDSHAETLVLVQRAIHALEQAG